MSFEEKRFRRNFLITLGGPPESSKTGFNPPLLPSRTGVLRDDHSLSSVPARSRGCAQALFLRWAKALVRDGRGVANTLRPFSMQADCCSVGTKLIRYACTRSDHHEKTIRCASKVN